MRENSVLCWTRQSTGETVSRARSLTSETVEYHGRANRLRPAVEAAREAHRRGALSGFHAADSTPTTIDIAAQSLHENPDKPYKTPQTKSADNHTQNQQGTSIQAGPGSTVEFFNNPDKTHRGQTQPNRPVGSALSGKVGVAKHAGLDRNAERQRVHGASALFGGATPTRPRPEDADLRRLPDPPLASFRNSTPARPEPKSISSRAPARPCRDGPVWPA